MLKSELIEIISNGESSGIEFKRDDIRSEQLAREVVALVNFQGGRILLGVEDDGTISGLCRDNTEEWVMNVISEKVHPIVLPFYEQIRIDDNLNVAVLSFPQGNSKPYVLRHKGEEKVFIRIGSTSRMATREQQMRLYEIGGMLHTETLPVSRTSSNDLDMVRMENYLDLIINDPDIPGTREKWEERLGNLGFLTEPNGMCTIAGMVLFAKNPRKYFKQSGLRVFAFNSTEKEYKAELDTILNAPLVGRWDLSQGSKELLDDGLLERFLQVIDPFISEEPDEIHSGFRRKKQYSYPMEAIREILVNALVHRDWTRFVDIEIGIYSDRFEVISPGSLQNSMTIEKMIAGRRYTRNTIIMGIMRDYGYVDFRGMGIRTKVIPKMREFNGTSPIFKATEDYVKVILLKK